MALQDELVFEYFKILLAKSKKSKSSSENAPEESEQINTEKTGSTSKNQSATKAAVEEVERALYAAIQEQSDNPTDSQPPAEDNPSSVPISTMKGRKDIPISMISSHLVL